MIQWLECRRAVFYRERCTFRRNSQQFSKDPKERNVDQFSLSFQEGSGDPAEEPGQERGAIRGEEASEERSHQLVLGDPTPGQP